jgi:hypothetical protein
MIQQHGGARSIALGAMALVAILALFAGSETLAQGRPQAERSPPGDIPDDQIFVPYASPLGFSLQVPEGWSRSQQPDGVRFSDKYNVIEAHAAQVDTAATAVSAQSLEAADVMKSGQAVRITAVKEVRLKAGPALRVTYTANSEVNPVTNKQVRLEHERFIFSKDGKRVSLDFAAPTGADNADQWQLMSNSFRWN